MNQVFLEILDHAWFTSLLILTVIVFRFIFKKVPKFINCILWGIVGLKLMLPFDIRSAFGLLPSEKTIETVSKGIRLSPIIVRTGIAPLDTRVNDYISAYSKNQSVSQNPVLQGMDVLCFLWVTGFVVMLLYLIVSYLLMCRKVSQSVVIEKNIRICDKIDSPFLFGIVKPRIYLPSCLEKNNREYVISHERMHLRRGDFLWKPLGFLVLSVYWFHPLCWISYILLCKDIELACDEMVIKKQDASWRANYCQVLLECSVGNGKYSAIPLAFGEVGVKERVKHVMKYKKTKLGIVIAAIIICIAVVICFGTKENNKTVASTDNIKSETAENVIPVSVPKVDLSASTGADGARLYYADDDTIIFGGYFGLFVYNTGDHKFFRSVDLKPIDCADTQGENACEITVKSDGSEVYLHQMGVENRTYMYVYHVKENTLTKEKYQLGKQQLFSGVEADGASVLYTDKDGKEDSCWLINPMKTIGELGYKYPDEDAKVYPLFVEDDLQGAGFWKPDTITDVTKAEITYKGTHYVCTDKKTLKMLEDGLRNGKKTQGLSACPFDDVMFLTKKDGSVGMVVPAMDGCKACLLEDGFYELDDSISISIYDMIQKGYFQKIR